MEPSAYQLAVYDHLRRRGGNSAVISVAGSGKTETAIEGIGHIPTFYSVMISAFNVKIREEFRRRGIAKGYGPQVKYSNYNGFGWGICLREMRTAPILDEEKTLAICEVLFQPKSEEDDRRFRRLAYPIKRLVSLFRAMAIHDVETARARYADVVDHHCIEVPEDEAFEGLLFDTFRDCINHTAHMDFMDQVYMPIHLGLNVPRYDQVLVDEFQDTCEAELQLLMKAADQMCGLGDPDQSIYGFKGATPDQFARYVKLAGARELPLSICYRCPRAVIAEAKRIVPRIEAAPWAAEGSVDTVPKAEFRKRVKPGDFVICRVTEHLVRECLADIREGRSSRVWGREVGDALVELVAKIDQQRDLDVDRFVVELNEHRIRRSKALQRARQDAKILKLCDEVDTIIALTEGMERVANLIKRIDSIFVPDGTNHGGVDYLTIHKSKGLQARVVWLLRPDILPHPRSQEREWMMEEERRLEYVAITRATEAFYRVLKAPGER